MQITREYELLRQQLACLPRDFQDGKGILLFHGRNRIRKFTLADGTIVVVKRYKRHDLIKSIIYTFFRTNKARRSFDNAHELLSRGFDTPHPIAYWEEKKMGLIRQVYYACEYTEAQAIRQRLIDQEPFDEQLATAYARFVASLHENGILHRDLNPTNVLFTCSKRAKEQESEKQYHFQLIDINRMRFYDSAVPKAECMENLTLFWWLTDVYRFILREYANIRGWTDEDIEEAINVKERHDRRWIRRKNFTAIFKHKNMRK